MLKSRIHNALVTASATLVNHADKDYAEALLMDRELMRLADLWPYECVEVSNRDNGARFSIPVVAGQQGRREIEVIGAAAYLVQMGHRLTICSYSLLSEADLPKYQLKLVNLGELNEPV